MIRIGLIILTTLFIITGCFSSTRPPLKNVSFEMRLVANGNSEKPISVKSYFSDDVIKVEDRAIVDIRNIIGFQSVKTPYKTYTILAHLDKTGAESFALATENNIGRKIAILINGKAVTAPTIVEKISGGKFIIMGNNSVQEIREIMILLTGQFMY